jgi:putative ABC transport system substrate-binding protein
MPRIGIFFLATRDQVAGFLEAFRQGLHDHGYVESVNVAIEDRYADGADDRLPSLAAELIRLGVDVLVTGSTLAVARAAKQATTTTPIVMAGGSSDPVADGLVVSVARPGGNITGVVSNPAGLHGKRLELMQAMVPGLSRVVLLYEPTASAQPASAELAAAARSLGLQLELVEMSGPGEIESAFARIRTRRAEALVITTPMTYHYRQPILALALRDRLPVVAPWREVAEAGGLVSYAPDVLDQYRRAATYVDKILKGAKPADLPVELPTKFDFVINLKTAQALGLTIPKSVLELATEVIQ